jgi:phage tail-like protein
VTVEAPEPAAFSTVIIPTVEIDVVEYRDGTDRTNQPRQVVGLTKYTNLVLKRGIANHPDLWAWFDQVRQGTIDRARSRSRC